MELIREIFLAVESGNTGSLVIDGYDEQVVAYHVRALIEADYICGELSSDTGGINAYVSHLTWSGHDFLDAARDQHRWNKAQEIVREKSGSITFDLLKQLLASLMKQAIGIG